MSAKPTKPKKPVPKAQPKTTKRSRKLMIVLLVIGLAALISLALIYRTQQEHKRQQAAQLTADKAAFATVETQMAKTYAAIVASAGKPEKSELSKDCGRPNLKFATGNINCTVTYRFNYTEKDPATAYEHLKGVQDAISASMFLEPVSSKLTDKFDQSSQFSSLQSIGIDLRGGVGVHCGINLKYGPYVNDPVTKPYSKYSLECSKPVNVRVYTLTE